MGDDMGMDSMGTLHGLVEDRVGRAPEAVAVEYEGRTIAYGELNSRANRLARHLREVSGVRPDDPVVISARHPPDVVVAVLAVLKAGGAYVPLDPDNAPGLTRRMIEAVAPRAVLIESGTAAGAAFFDGDLFVLDVMAPQTVLDTNPTPAAGPGDLAYILHTSGTTGTPRAVAVEHRAVLNTVRWRNAYYGFAPGDVHLAIPGPTFDSSVEDMFCALACGARLLLPRRDQITDRSYLVDLVDRQGVSHFLITPSLYHRLLSGLDRTAASALRSVTVAGEQLSLDLVREHYRRLPGTRLFNEYGPCENSVCSTVQLLAADDERVLIGRPIDGVAAVVLDEKGAEAAAEEVGELYLGGAGLARGYHREPALTAEKFTARPSGAVPGSGAVTQSGSCTGSGSRVYRTGDLVRRLSDGTLEFVGRADRQLKIRGRRVEPAQIAACLTEDASVREAYILCQDSESGTPRLVAFVVGARADDVPRLRGLAAERLPAYMVPADVVPVDELPLTGHGKVDEKALAALACPVDGSPGAAAPSPVEACLLDVWKRILGHGGFGVDDDFFAVGGDSLSVMDLVAELESLLGVRVDSAQPYISRTIHDLARVVETSPRIQPSDS
ncbi:non-ribosomal peptide synthetase [Catenulispora sp. NL8]|uniref:Non-ribosomal peptide synthetase n=1 Tax=Catenulispora pinistramenti TaxID=2705254 RepID=A0ABS5KL29_9ACTN|nr:non-ribosomal peptide synthetase [Catenulispora pinistramenti]MBS2546753.1 non-ribosomal peptide synthetase [Catenulispora pinistramenti]